MGINFGDDMSKPGFLTATDEEIEKQINSEIAGKINLYHPLTVAVMQQFWADYRCDRCGKCCLGELAPADIGLMLIDFELQELAKIKQIPVEEFKDRFTVIRNGKLILKYPCPFYDKNISGCGIYTERPIVCRLYPINLPVKANGYHPEVDGTYLLTVDSCCPEARKVAIKWLKGIRDAYTSLSKLSQDKYTGIQNQVFAGLKDARKWQEGLKQF